MPTARPRLPTDLVAEIEYSVAHDAAIIQGSRWRSDRIVSEIGRIIRAGGAPDSDWRWGVLDGLTDELILRGAAADLLPAPWAERLS